MGLLDWFRRRRKKKTDKEKEVLERTGKLQTEIKKARRKRTEEEKKEGERLDGS